LWISYEYGFIITLKTSPPHRKKGYMYI
jgi:hypothetical protein